VRRGVGDARVPVAGVHVDGELHEGESGDEAERQEHRADVVVRPAHDVCFDRDLQQHAHSAATSVREREMRIHTFVIGVPRMHREGVGRTCAV
jgi:hypothetical protein